MDGKAERGRICESDSKMVDHDNCCRGVVTVHGAETGQHVGRNQSSNPDASIDKRR